MIGKVGLHENQDKPHAVIFKRAAGQGRLSWISNPLPRTRLVKSCLAQAALSSRFHCAVFPPCERGRALRLMAESSGDTILSFPELGMVSPEPQELALRKRPLTACLPQGAT